jgi:hypothetical protein
MAKDSPHNKGESDYKKSGGQVNSNPITEFVNPSYNPPSDPKGTKEYKAGWDNAKKQDR